MIARTLARRIVIRTTERAAHEALRFVACDPEIDAPPVPDHVITVEPYRGRYRVLEDGVEPVETLGEKATVDEVHKRYFQLSVAAHPTAGLLHAACLRRNGRRILLAGKEAAGKTSLTLRLVRSGYELEGDENVFVENDGVIARPRSCRVKQHSLSLFPDIADLIRAAPAYVDDFGLTTYNLDPRAIGGTWRIEKGEVDCVFLLAPNHGGFSSIRRSSPITVAEMLVSELGRRDAGTGASLAAIAKLVSRAKGFDLSLGDHASAIACIEGAIAASSTAAGLP